jgi:hypothetical protein
MKEWDSSFGNTTHIIEASNIQAETKKLNLKPISKQVALKTN